VKLLNVFAGRLLERDRTGADREEPQSCQLIRQGERRVIVGASRVPDDHLVESGLPGQLEVLLVHDREHRVRRHHPPDAAENLLPLHPVQARAGGDEGIRSWQPHRLGRLDMPHEVAAISPRTGAPGLDHRRGYLHGVDPVRQFC
jgi:hypothetical protein